jgi:hypothetical protein
MNCTNDEQEAGDNQEAAAGDFTMKVPAFKKQVPFGFHVLMIAGLPLVVNERLGADGEPTTDGG